MRKTEPGTGRQSVGPAMVHIPAGEFLMGSNPQKVENAMGWEQPRHRVFLPDYYLSKTPVTQAQYALFVAACDQPAPPYWGGQVPPEADRNHPVVDVSWYEALAYCAWLSEQGPKRYRLPSEAEWEKGARGPWMAEELFESDRTYPWGDRWDPRKCNTRESGHEATTPVDVYPKGVSPYGLLDMAGNVWEWTRSLWGPDPASPAFVYPYDPNDGRENVEAGADVFRVLRGGSAYVPRNFARCAYRYWSGPRFCNHFMGFRLAAYP